MIQKRPRRGEKQQKKGAWDNARRSYDINSLSQHSIKHQASSSSSKAARPPPKQHPLTYIQQVTTSHPALCYPPRLHINTALALPPPLP